MCLKVMALQELCKHYALDNPFDCNNSSIFNKIYMFGIMLLLKVNAIIITTCFYTALYMVAKAHFYNIHTHFVGGWVVYA